MRSQRERAIQRVQARLQRRASPRAHMMLLVMCTAAFGFLSSYLLLHAGVTAMAIRYPLAVGFAYLAFLAMVALWLRRYRLRAEAHPRAKGGVDFDLDVVNVPLDQLWSTPSAPEPDFTGFGGGGGFSGGGGGASWGSGSTTLSDAGSASADAGGGFDLDIGEGALWLIPVLIIAAIALSVVLYIVYLAPALFAELLLDAGLAAGLYKRLMKVERHSWLATAVRSTIIPACFVAALLALAGTIMQGAYPDAISIGAVAKHLNEPHGVHPQP